MDYSIESFWCKQFASVIAQTPSKKLPGWNHSVSKAPFFVEANLSLREGFCNLSERVWMIAAPGAVGKSTLARQICSATNAVYLDLSEAATVAGNYLVGGLVNADLWGAWQAGKTTLLIDALDEARLRVTQTSFEDFLFDVANVAANRNIPIVLLGRVGIVEEAWLILNDRSTLKPPIFDIELFNNDQAKSFVLSALDRLASVVETSSERKAYPHLATALNAHSSVYKDAVNFLVEHLTSETSADGHKFAGYAPVLEAVATVIASESNPTKINNAITSLLQGRVLARVTSEIMVREAGKLANQLTASHPGIDTTGLYGPAEQLSRLASHILGVGMPEIPTNIPQRVFAAYDDAVRSLLPQHPFLDSKEPKPSGAVFGARILAAALNSRDTGLVRAAEVFAGGGPNTPNPFLLDFYRESWREPQEVPASHVGLLYASLEANAGAGDMVRLSAEGDEVLEVEMSIVQPNGAEKPYNFTTRTTDTLRFGRRVGGITVDAEMADIEIGEGGQVELVAPIVLHGRTLYLNCLELVVKSDHAVTADPIVFLEAKELVTETGLRAPLVRTGAKLHVTWPDSKIYPWTSFASDEAEDPDPRLAEAQRALRRLCISFRSHSKGRLARYKEKVEHLRMTRGDMGIALRESLMKDKVVTLEGPMYFLDPDLLGSVVGVNFQDLKLKRYSDKSRNYLKAILDKLAE